MGRCSPYLSEVAYWYKTTKISVKIAIFTNNFEKQAEP